MLRLDMPFYKIIFIPLIVLTSFAQCYPQARNNLLSYYSPPQRIDSLLLVDSSVVTIGSNTALLMYDSSRVGRCIYTNGQISIDRPDSVKDTFRFILGNQVIKVLSGSFDIQHFDSSQLIFNLIKGDAVIESNLAKRRITHQGASVTIKSNEILIGKIADIEEASYWRKGLYIFDLDSSTMEDIMITLSNVYGVKLDYDKIRAKKIRVIGAVSFIDSIEDNLECFKLAKILEYKKNKDRYTVKFVM